MEAPKVLKIFTNNLWITLIILLIFVGITIYYLLLPENTRLTLLGWEFPVENTKAVALIIFILGIFVNTFINLLTGLLQKDQKSDKNVQNSQPQFIVPPIEIKNFINSQPEIKKTEETQQNNSKFYPINFLPDLKFFVGREKLLKDLEKKLAKEHRASIHDISGLGKTYTTYKFAEDFQGNYDKIFFVRTNKEEMLQSLAEMGVLLNPFLKNEPDQSKQAYGFKHWLEENEKWLVIYDNVDLPNELKPYVPTSKKGDCLFTSNFPSIKNLADEVKIEKLGEKDAKQLLFSRANNKPHSKIVIADAKERVAFETIVREIDGHPLALNTTGAFISENVITFAEFERKLQNTPTIVLENEDGFDNYQRKSVLKAFTIAIADVAAPKASDKFANSAELAQKLLAAVGFTAPDNIPEVFLQTILQKITGIDFLSEENEDLWQEIRRKLLTYDLLKYDKWAKLFNTHRLIQKVVQTKQNDDQKAVIKHISVALDELFDYSEYETRENCELYTPHAVVLVEEAQKIELTTEEVARLYYKIGNHLIETVKYKVAKSYFEEAIALYENLFGKENRTISVYLDRLARVYQLQGEYTQAEKFYKEALEIAEKTVGKEHSVYATYLSNLANVYGSQGKYNEAIALLKEALLIDEKNIGKQHPYYAIELNNLANVYYSQGKYDEAIELYQEALLIDEKTIGKKHPDYAVHLNNLANVYESQSKYDEAIELYKQALLIGVKTIGKEHPSYAIRLSNLAVTYENQEKYQDALKLYQEALQIRLKTLPENHHHIKNSKQSIERCQKILGEK